MAFEARPRAGLVHIVTGSFGAGHDAAAREIALRFEARGYETRTWDIVDLFPAGIGRALRAAFLFQLRTAPETWGLLLHGLRPGGLAHRVATSGLAITHTRLRALTVPEPDVIVSTHPFASQALGQMRASGTLDVQVVTYLTDMSVHPMWVHPAVDLHLALHEVPASQARRWHGRTTVVRPLVPGVYAAPSPPVPSREEHRRRLGLPTAGPLLLVTGGSRGIGPLERAARDIAATGVAKPVVLCGHNRALFDRLAGDPSIGRLGWRDDIPVLMRAVDGVVQNAGGFLSLEALAAGTPAVTYRCVPGHGETNAAALDRAGLIPWARSQEELTTQLIRALTGRQHPHGLAAGGSVDIVDAVFPQRARVPA
ncbi:MAG: MGDG synthase family glycosyltransferase [Nocardioidaceae bacterium]